ncbi:MAG: flippase-like domain-containing protein [Gemmataceae bacterium]|nr:flippase-like domain-containing protein [Gemmataceae bacterium]
MLRLFFTIFKYALAISLLAYVVHSNWMPGSETGLEAVWKRHAVEGQPLHWGFFLASLFFYLLGLLLTLVRWHAMMQSQELGISFGQAIRLGFIGFFFNTFLPGSVGGDVVKAAAVCRNQARRSVAVSVVLLDRAIALWGLIFFAGASGALFWALGYFSEGAAAQAGKIVVKMNLGFCLVTGFGWFMLARLPLWRVQRFEGRLRRWVAGPAAEFWLTFWRFRQMPGVVFKSLLISWCGHICLSLAFFFAAQVFRDGHAVPSVGLHFLIVPLGLVIQAVPMFPGGAGIGELGFGALYAWFGAEKAMGVTASLVQRLATWFIAVGGYLICAAWRGGKNGGPVETIQPEEPSRVQGPWGQG